MPKSGIRVLHISEAPLGGVLSYIQEIVATQIESDDIAHIELLVSDINVPPLSHLVGSKVSLKSFPFSRKSLPDLVRVLWVVRKAIAQSGSHIVHIHSTWAGVLARIAAMSVFRRPKIIYCPHSWAFTRKAGPVVTVAIAALERFLATITDRIVCVSHAERRDGLAAGLPGKKLIVIENGIHNDNEAYREKLAPMPGAPKRILFVGRFDQQKGFDTLAEVLAHLEGSAVGTAIGGYLVNSGETVATPRNLTIMGWKSRDEVRPFFSEADLLLMPSRWEGLPIVALEAMRDGLPIFATKVGGLEDVVIDGITGRLFETHDPEHIASTIRATDIETLLKYGQNARARFLDRFTATRMNSKLIDLYAELAGFVQANRTMSQRS